MVPLALYEPRTEVKVPHRVLAEGRIVDIDIEGLDYLKNVSGLLNNDPDAPVKVRIVGDNGYYINVFDHRQRNIAAFRGGGFSSYWEHFDDVPCIGGFRMKGKTMYIVLADIGRPDFHDGGDDDRYCLTLAGAFNHETEKVLGNNGSAYHPATKLCLVGPRAPKT